MKDILVVYYSRSGNTERVARMLAKELDADIECIVEQKISSYFIACMKSLFKKETEIGEDSLSPSSYKLIVVGTPIWAWNVIPPVRKYLSVHKSSIGKVAFFTSAGGTGPEKIVHGMEEILGKKAVAAIGFTDPEYHKGKESALAEKVARFASMVKNAVAK